MKTSESAKLREELAAEAAAGGTHLALTIREARDLLGAAERAKQAEAARDALRLLLGALCEDIGRYGEPYCEHEVGICACAFRRLLQRAAVLVNAPSVTAAPAEAEDEELTDDDI